MPADVAKKISDAARQAIASPEVRKRIEAQGATPVGDSPEEFARFVHEEIGRWGKVVKFSGAKAE
jgi:tripartite-type tricarboxylate transporter receptor subunit TctC